MILCSTYISWSDLKCKITNPSLKWPEWHVNSWCNTLEMNCSACVEFIRCCICHKHSQIIVQMVYLSVAYKYTYVCSDLINMKLSNIIVWHVLICCVKNVSNNKNGQSSSDNNDSVYGLTSVKLSGLLYIRSTLWKQCCKSCVLKPQ